MCHYALNYAPNWVNGRLMTKLDTSVIGSRFGETNWVGGRGETINQSFQMLNGLEERKKSGGKLSTMYAIVISFCGSICNNGEKQWKRTDMERNMKLNEKERREKKRKAEKWVFVSLYLFFLLSYSEVASFYLYL